MIDAVLVFHDVPHRNGWFWKLLKPGFGHVQVWIMRNDLWIQLDGCLEALFIRTHERAPWELLDGTHKAKYNPRFLPQRYTIRTGRVREPFHFGPVTCVELTKAILGIRAPLVRTPWQLYKHLTRK